MAILGELWHAWRTSRRLLASRRDVLREHPGLRDGVLYALVVARLSRLDLKDAEEVLLRARESWCRWPLERELRLRDLLY